MVQGSPNLALGPDAAFGNSPSGPWQAMQSSGVKRICALTTLGGRGNLRAQETGHTSTKGTGLHSDHLWRQEVGQAEGSCTGLGRNAINRHYMDFRTKLDSACRQSFWLHLKSTSQMTLENPEQATALFLAPCFLLWNSDTLESIDYSLPSW